MKRLLLSAPLLALAAVGAPVMLSAQALKNHDSNAPVNFTADRIEVQDRSDRVVVSGNVVVTQAGMTLTAARMTVAYHNPPSAASAGTGTGTGTGNGPNVEIDRIDASGDVVVTKQDQTARGNVAIYDLNTRLITMLGNVSLTQGANRLTGGRLVMDLNSGRSTVDGHSAGGGTPGIAGSGGRVSGTFTVPQRK